MNKDRIERYAEEIHSLVSQHAFQRNIIDQKTVYELPRWFDELERMLDNVASLCDDIRGEFDEDPEVDTSTFANHDGTFAEND